MAAATNFPPSGDAIRSGTPPSMRFVAPGKALVGWRQDSVPSTSPLFMGAKPWERWSMALQYIRPTLIQVMQSLEADRFAWDLDPQEGLHVLLPHWGPMKESMLWLSLDIACRLRKEQWTEAHQALTAQLNLVRATTEAPGAISQAFKQALGVIAFQSTWDAWQGEGWNDAQWRTLQAQWAEMDFIGSMTLAAEVDRRSGLIEFARCRREPSHFVTCTQSTNRFGNAMRTRAWAWLWSWEDERAFLGRTQALLEVARSADTGNDLLTRVSGVQSGHEKADLRHALSHALLRWPQRAFERASTVEAIAGLAVAGIALKRYALQHEGDYPAALETLVPVYLESLPTDWMDGLPLRYKRTAENTFLLYSVGVNGVDDGGDPSPREGAENPQFFAEGRDVVWPWPAELGSR